MCKVHHPPWQSWVSHAKSHATCRWWIQTTGFLATHTAPHKWWKWMQHCRSISAVPLLLWCCTGLLKAGETCSCRFADSENLDSIQVQVVVQLQAFVATHYMILYSSLELPMWNSLPPLQCVSALLCDENHAEISAHACICTVGRLLTALQLCLNRMSTHEQEPSLFCWCNLSNILQPTGLNYPPMLASLLFWFLWAMWMSLTLSQSADLR